MKKSLKTLIFASVVTGCAAVAAYVAKKVINSNKEECPSTINELKDNKDALMSEFDRIRKERGWNTESDINDEEETEEDEEYYKEVEEEIEEDEE